MIELVRPILETPFFYELFNSVIGANNCRRVLASEYIRPKCTDRILDIGCGSGNMLPFLPECDYLGVDLNESYIASAKQRYGHRGEFVFDRVSHLNVERFGAFDVALAVGLVHHLDDSEARDLFRLAFTALKVGGRLISMEICHTANESNVKRYLLSRDRGQFVRNQEQYIGLAHSCFSKVTPTLRSDLLRLPYTHLIMECVR
jgi:cyclopropane fatty-acyl-phospholipid synthase-like methyltransferase